MEVLTLQQVLQTKPEHLSVLANEDAMAIDTFHQGDHLFDFVWIMAKRISLSRVWIGQQGGP